jgi:hypothetical protein
MPPVNTFEDSFSLDRSGDICREARREGVCGGSGSGIVFTADGGFVSRVFTIDGRRSLQSDQAELRGMGLYIL